MNEVILRSDNAIEAADNMQKLGKSLVDIFKHCCIDEKIEPNWMRADRSYYYSDIERARDHNHLDRESAHINFSDGQPNLSIYKNYNNVYVQSMVKKEVISDYGLSKWKLLRRRFGKKYYEMVQTETFKESKPECVIEHGKISMKLTEQQFDLLFHFVQEQRETKLNNIEIKKLAGRLEEFGVYNPLKK